LTLLTVIREHLQSRTINREGACRGEKGKSPLPKMEKVTHMGQRPVTVRVGHRDKRTGTVNQKPEK